MFSLAELEHAQRIVHAAMPPTAAHAWPLLSERLGASVVVKHENHTPIGAFKVRGGLVYLDQMTRAAERIPGIVTATSGNHGQSVPFAARRYDIPVLVVVPHGNSVEKNAAMRGLGAELREEGNDFQAAVEAADRIAIERGWHRLPSYHPSLVSGVGTYALERIVLQHAEHLGLGRQTRVADLIEENRPVVRGLEFSRTVFYGRGEGAFDVAE